MSWAPNHFPGTAAACTHGLMPAPMYYTYASPWLVDTGRSDEIVHHLKVFFLQVYYPKNLHKPILEARKLFLLSRSRGERRRTQCFQLLWLSILAFQPACTSYLPQTLRTKVLDSVSTRRLRFQNFCRRLLATRKEKIMGLALFSYFTLCATDIQKNFVTSCAPLRA